MTLVPVLLTLALSAEPAFPPPKLVPVAQDLKCDWGPVLVVDAVASEMQVMTPAGPVTFKVGPDAQVIGADGKPAGAFSSLKQGSQVRVYYVVNNGARVREIDTQ